MIFFPSRGRPQKLLKVVEAFKETKATLPVLLILDEDDAHNYAGVREQLPSNFGVMINRNIMDFKAAVDAGYEAYPNEPWYAGGSDDFYPLTEGWDVKLRDACLPHFMSWGDDGCHGGNLASAPFFGGDLIRRLGWLMPPFLKRGYADFLWMAYGRELGICKYMPEVKFDHRHWQIQGADGKRKGKFDATYAIQPSVVNDRLACDAYIASPQFKADCVRLRKELNLD
jgi:hypothetical protein